MTLAIFRFKLRTTFRRAKDKWPWMPKKQHMSILAERLRQERISAASSANAEKRELRNIMDKVVPKLVAASVDRSFSNDRFRLVLDLDPFLIRDAFMWGNDDKALTYFCEMVGHHVLREMKGLNAHRYASELPPTNPRLARYDRRSGFE